MTAGKSNREPPFPDTAVMARQIVQIFEANYKRGPWPNEIQCHDLAVSVLIARWKKFAQFDESSLPDRRSTVNAMKKLITKQREKFPAKSKTGSRLSKLELMLNEIEPALLWPFDPIFSMEVNRRRSHQLGEWQRSALYIALSCREVLERTGRKASLVKNSPFWATVADLLAMATDQDIAAGTIAAALPKHMTT